MKVLKLGWVAIALIAMINASASAADRPSRDTLNAMGLGGIVVMDDATAMNVRGFGYSGHSKKGSSKSSARAWGSSYASINSHGGQAHSENGYDSKGKHIALGANISVAGVRVEYDNYHNGGGGGPAAAKSSKGGKGGGGYGGGGHGGGGSKPRVKSVTVFAGGGSFAYAD